MAKEMELLSDKYQTIVHTMGATAGSAGDVVSAGNVRGFLLRDAPANSDVVLVVRADRVRVAKPTNLQLTAGSAVYFDHRSANRTLSTTVSANTWLVGVVQKSANASDSYANVVFDGFANFLKA